MSLLQPLLADPDAVVAASAAAALGHIAGQDALAVLEAAPQSAAPEVRAAVIEARMRCAEKLRARGQVANAREIYESLTKTLEPDYVRVAAYVGVFRCAGQDALAQIKAALQGEDAAAQVAALQLAGEIQDAQATTVLAELLPKSHPALQVALLALLRTRGDVAILPSVQAAARSQDASVRTAALVVMGELGDASMVPLLAQAATSSEPAEQKAAREALATLRRGDVAGALVAQIIGAAPVVQVELARALTTRDEKAAVPALIELARGGQPAARRQRCRRWAAWPTAVTSAPWCNSYRAAPMRRRVTKWWLCSPRSLNGWLTKRPWM